MSPIKPIILAGGSGRRLWPVSNGGLPKQFLPLFGGQSTFELTLHRVADRALFAEPVVVANAQWSGIVRAKLGTGGICLIEPEGRDSGPAVAAACAYEMARGHGDAALLVLASDHLIADDDAFAAACRDAFPSVQAGHIIMFGLPAVEPRTGFGYIRPERSGPGPDYKALAFIEKPDAAAALRLLNEGCLWNSGNFMVRADTLATELAAHAPAMWDAAVNAVGNRSGADIALDPAAFEAAPVISIDRAILEKTGKARVIPVDYIWSDIGSWNALWEAFDKDEAGNAVIGDADLVDVEGCFVHSPDQPVQMVGTSDLFVSVSDDLILIADRARVDDIARAGVTIETVAENKHPQPTETE